MKKIVLMVAALMAAMAAQAKDYELKSPDGKIVVTVSSGAHVSYSIVREGIRLLSPSQISMMLLDSIRSFRRGTSSGPKSVTISTR